MAQINHPPLTEATEAHQYPRTPRHCRAKKPDGSPCGAFAVLGSDLCFWHDPNRQEQAQRARVRGGLVKAIKQQLAKEARSENSTQAGQPALA